MGYQPAFFRHGIDDVQPSTDVREFSVNYEPMRVRYDQRDAADELMITYLRRGTRHVAGR